MSVFRVEKNQNYTTMSNYHLRDTELSLKAIGLLSKILSLPDDWDYSIAGLAAICKEGETAIKSALSELKDHGYIVINKLNPDQSGTGRFAYEYVVYEEPQTLEVEKQGVEILPLENQGQLNKEELNKEKSNKDNKEIDAAILEAINDYTTNDELRTALIEFAKMRKRMRKPLTPYAFWQSVKRLGERDYFERVEMVNQSIEKGWLTFYDVKSYHKRSVSDSKPVYSSETITELDDVFEGLKTRQKAAFGVA